MATRTRTAPAPTKGSEDTAAVAAVPEVTDVTGLPEIDKSTYDLYTAPMRILVVGNDFKDTEKVKNTLGEVGKRYADAGSAFLIHAGVEGADRIAAGQWTHWGFSAICIPPLWNTYKRSAGVRRNIEVIDLMNPATDVVLIFGNSKAAVHAASYAEERMVTTVRIA